MIWQSTNLSVQRKAKKYCKRELVFTALLVITLGTAFGQSIDSTNSGSSRFDKQFYGGVGLGVSELAPESMCPCLTVGDGSDQAISLFLGVDLAKRLSVEAFVSDLGASEILFNGDAVGDVEYQIGGVSLLGYLFGTRVGSFENESTALARREGLSGFLRLGAGVMENDSRLDYDRDHTTHMHAGLGLEYGWSNGLALRAEVTGYDTDAAYGGFTLLKRFGKEPRKAAKSRYTAIADPAAALPESDTAESVARTAVPSEATTAAPKLELTTTYFDFGKADLTTATQQVLDEVAAYLLTYEGRIVTIEGHTDEIDTKEYNMMLSLDRAGAVRRYLAEKGVDAMRMRIAGFGESRPVADNRTEQGRQLNRRVEIKETE